ncbi:MAG: methyltransferase domain-containing protein [bacterium]|nr:methyltransferase domain-containing protein [bacterium]
MTDAPNTPDDVKAHSRARFSKYAHGYVTSPTHSQGADLDRLLEIAAPQPHWVAVDVATGGGHTALSIAPFVRRMIATDYALTMLGEARAFIQSTGVKNVEFVPADAENLPFADSSVDLVTCRIAAHHFPDAFRFVRESARILKPGGRLVVQDHVLPDDKAAAAYIEAFERLRDPSHHVAFADYEWRGMYLDAGLTVDHSEILSRPARMIPWAERQGCTPDVIERLQILMIQAPNAVRDFYQMSCAGTPDAAFAHIYVLMAGTKPE